MPRNRGFLARIGQALGNVFRGLGDAFREGGEPPPPRPTPRRPGPAVRPPPPAPPPVPPRPSLTRELRVWRDVSKGNDRYDSYLADEWFELYRSTVDPLQMEEDEFFQFWREFLKAFYLTSGERGSIRRDTFYRRIGIRKRDFGMDWQEWRELKRGTP